MKSVIGALVALLVGASAASAHSFKVTMIIPAGQSDTARQAFLIASAERDSHANQTSDGHLGGVDSHIRFVEIPGDADAIALQVFDSDPDIVVFVAAYRAQEPLADRLKGSGIWTFGVTSVSERAASDFLGGAAAFSSRYLARTGAEAGPVALQVYIAARLIDLAVRPQDGVDDIGALARAVATY